MPTSSMHKPGVLAIAALGAAAVLSPVAAQEFEAVQGNTAVSDFVSRQMGSKPATVIVLLAGDPVAVVQRDLGRRLNPSERNAVIASRLAEQRAMHWAIGQLGGKVLAQLQSALNGIKVAIPEGRLAALRKLPGVVDVKRVGNYERVNVNAVPLMGAPAAWQSLGQFRGQGMKIAILDTGIDYTHANFGGPGTVAAYNTAFASNTLAANPAWFGPGAPKVKGGTDLVGDAYTGSNAPQPDANPLDCPYTAGTSGHGSHVAGTAAGFGVKADGSTYAGPYTAAAYTPGAFSIGPGVAPQADLYAVRVFGCSGSTNVVSEAIDWAVANGMDVISMSLGSNYGVVGNSDPGSLAEQAAVANAVSAGILVVAASGNAGPTPYITSAPAVFDGAISVAATDAMAGIPMANLALSRAGAGTIAVQVSNGVAFVNGTSYPVHVLRNADGTVSLGCNPDEYDPAKTGVSLAGKMVVSVRGTCARTFRAGAAQHFGAAAAAMINSSAGLPPYEGPIPGGAPDPNSGNMYEPVTIPFFGVAQADGAALAGPNGSANPVGNAVATGTGLVANAGFEKIASFSSMGPRIGDSVLKPGVTAPGVAVVSTASGTGNGFQTMSGTSMATPGVAGVAALAKQANPSWPVADLRAAIVQTASPTLMKDYLPRNEGAGLVQAQSATTTQAVVRMPNESISFGYADLLNDYSQTKQVTVHNAGPKAVQFNISTAKASGPAGVTVVTPPSVIVNANSDASFPVTLNVPANAVGGGTAFQDVSGVVQLTPSNTRLNGNVKLSVPYYLVAHSRSNMAVARNGNDLTLSNVGGAMAGTPVFYSLGLHQPAAQGVTQNDVRAVGTQMSGTNILFGVNTHNRTSTTLAFQEVDICIDTSGNTDPSQFKPNFVLIGINASAFSSTAPKNAYYTALFPTDANCNITGGGSTLFSLTQPTDNSWFQLAVPRGGSGTSGLGLTSAQPRFMYRVYYFGSDGYGAAMPGIGRYNAFAPAVTFAGGGAVAPNGSGAATVTVNAAEQTLTPAAGAMVMFRDNVSGASQASLLSLP